MSWSKHDIQKKISNLENHCEKWGLELNLDKTKVMIFNKQGSTVKKHKFYFQGKKIEIVGQYTYLGFTFIPSGKKHKGIENLLKKASKAWFAIQRLLFKSRKKTRGTYLHLIEPII